MPLYTLQDNPIEEMQQLHLADCIWQIICRDLKPTFEIPNMVTHSDSASLAQQPPLESALAFDTASEQSTTISEYGSLLVTAAARSLGGDIETMNFLIEKGAGVNLPLQHGE